MQALNFKIKIINCIRTRLNFNWTKVLIKCLKQLKQRSQKFAFKNPKYVSTNKIIQTLKVCLI